MRFKSIYTTFFFLFLAYIFLSFSGGVSANRANAPGDGGYCNSCHTGTGTGSIVLSGEPAIYVAGTTYPLTLTLNDPDAMGIPLARGGFQIVATNGTNNAQVGTFVPSAGTTLVGSGRLTHSTPINFSGASSISWTFDWTAPTTGAPANVQFYFAGNAANGNGGNGAGDNTYAAFSSTIPLPVELSQFDVTSMNDTQVKLKWQTRSESNSDYFEIQRSTENDDNIFESIGRIDAAGDATWINDYSFMDETPILNQQSYYRLKQVDRDGAFDYSPIQSVMVKSQDVVFNIYPNPIKNSERLNIDFTNNMEEKGEIRLTDMQGKVVFISEVEMLSGNNQLAINLPQLSIGQYLFSIEKNNQVIEISKLLVVD